MRSLVNTLAEIIVWGAFRVRHGPKRLKRQLGLLRGALEKETVETKEMFEIYNLYLRKKASPLQMKKANSQFRDLVKGFGLGVLVVLPFAPITLPLFVKIGEKMGVDLVPSAFSEGKGAKKNPVKRGFK